MFRVTIPPIIRNTIVVSATSGISRLHILLIPEVADTDIVLLKMGGIVTRNM